MAVLVEAANAGIGLMLVGHELRSQAFWTIFPTLWLVYCAVGLFSPFVRTYFRFSDRLYPFYDRMTRCG